MSNARSIVEPLNRYNVKPNRKSSFAATPTDLTI